MTLRTTFTLQETLNKWKCDLKWELPSGPKSCYKFQNHEKMDWSKAEKACKNAGMHLIALETEAELKLIALHLAKDPKLGYYWWTGGMECPGRLVAGLKIIPYGYYWDPGNTPITISWNKGQFENNENRETPVDLVNGGLSDYKRFEWIPHICEYSRSDLK
ncbi:hypothetical protein CAPTEDRAFT_218963 [Capitella teleta]|uniref:C-type lectin domain-containing protein n=1 Tax=Capitella teleta TaxID=283909 RepID=R7UJP4_CAPTE|nr:hypothetical protein CAPTEDRAFT_218963 [Capitella teleta]|eukprot:ELU06779.1 hypothetical protein CAPTEDRAFT_218963 [Capitella teleta]